MSERPIEAVFDDKEVKEFFKNLSDRLSDVKGGHRRFVGLLSAIVFKDILQHFKSEEGEDGPWKQWSDLYRAQLEKAGRGGNKILQYSGKLRQSFKPSNVKATSESLSWYNNAQTKSGFPYAAAHNEGGGILPKRDFMWLSDTAAEDMSKQTLAFILDEGV